MNHSTRVVMSVVWCSLGWISVAGAAPMLAVGVPGSLDLVVADGTNLDEVDGLAFDGFGNLFAVLEIDGTEGGLVYIDKDSGAVTSLLTGIVRADQVALHPSGDLFITSEQRSASSTNRVFRVGLTYDVSNVPISASVSSVTTSPDTLNNPEGLVVLESDSAYGNAGDLLVAEDIGFGRIISVDPDTGATGVLVGTGPALDRPEGLALGISAARCPRHCTLRKPTTTTSCGSIPTVALVWLGPRLPWG